MRTFLIPIVAFHFLFAPYAGDSTAHPQSRPNGAPGEGKSELSDAQLRELFEAINPPEWDYRKLADVSEVVVIATLRESVIQPGAEPKRDANDRSVEADGSFVTVSSGFEVKAVLKGKVADDQLSVLHLNWKPNVVVANDARFVRFYKELRVPSLVGVEVEGGIPQPSGTGDLSGVFTPEYLLFLRRDAGGTYELASGQRDAAASVRILNLVAP